jgi:SNF2 family DNA or RNA helicase
MVDGAAYADPFPLTTNAERVGDKNDPVAAFLVPLTWPNLVQLIRTLPGAVLDDDLTAYLLEQSALRTDPFEPLSCSIPDGKTPYPWQASAAAGFARIGASLLSDEPGTGKTISALLSLAERHARSGDAYPALVVSYASVLSSWYSHAQAWLPDRHSYAYRGPKRHLRHAPDVVVTSYDLALRDADKLGAYPWKTLVLDEHHAVKNRDAKRTQALTVIAKDIPLTIELSGTPITHSPDDIFAPLRMMDHLTYPSHDRYVGRYLRTVPVDYGVEVAGFWPDRVDEFNSSLAGVWRRVTKADALELPPKVYSERVVDMPAKWRLAYNAFAATMSASLPDDGGDLDVMTVLGQLTALMAMTSAPCTVEYTPNEDPNKPDHVHVSLEAPSWKVDALLDVLDERPEQQVVVFSPSRQLIDLAAAALDARDLAAKRPKSYGTIVGGQSVKARDAEVEAFQSGALRVILATTQAGGVGITLTAASTVVFLSRPWSLVDALQAEDRAHRIGSERHESIEIVDIVTAQSIDQRVRDVLRERHESLEGFLTGAAGVRELLRKD